MKSPKTNHQRGMTLLELSLVMFLVAVFMGIALPRFSTAFESDLIKDTKKMAKTIQDLRLAAITQSQQYRLVFDTKKNRYTISALKPGSLDQYIAHPTYSKPIQLSEGVQFRNVKEDEEEQVELRFGKADLEFEKIFGDSVAFYIDSSGFIDLFTVVLQDDVHKISLSVLDIMGKIKISDEEPL